MDEPYKNSNAATHQDFGGRTFTTIHSTTAVQKQKKKTFQGFSWAKNMARGVRLCLRFNTTFYWLNANRYTCF